MNGKKWEEVRGGHVNWIGTVLVVVRCRKNGENNRIRELREREKKEYRERRLVVDGTNEVVVIVDGFLLPKMLFLTTHQLCWWLWIS